MSIRRFNIFALFVSFHSRQFEFDAPIHTVFHICSMQALVCSCCGPFSWSNAWHVSLSKSFRTRLARSWTSHVPSNLSFWRGRAISIHEPGGKECKEMISKSYLLHSPRARLQIQAYKHIQFNFLVAREKKAQQKQQYSTTPIGTIAIANE